MNGEAPFLDMVTIAICAVAALGSSLYVCFGRVAIRAIIALFMCMFSVAWALVALGQEFLGFLCLFVGVAGASALLLYSSSIIGNIQEGRLEAPASARLAFGRAFGLIAGLAGGGLAATLLFRGEFWTATTSANGAPLSIGSAMMGDHAVSFILMSSACLGLMMGVGILVREARR